MTDHADDAAGGDADSEADADGVAHAVVLDVMPQGRPDDGRPQYEKSPVAYALDERDFSLYELTLADDAEVSVGDRLQVAPTDAADSVTRMRPIEFADLSGNAEAELEYAVADVVETDEERFVDFYNNAQPITLRLHQLNLLPGIGKKLRNNVLDERKRSPFESFEELEERVAGLHRPKEVLVERVLEELRDDDLKYKTFVGREEFA